MIDNKTARLAILERYLAAETTPAEEVALRQYYSSHPVDKDEKAIAQLIVATHPEHDYLSDESVCEFNQMIQRKRKRRVLNRPGIWIGVFASAAIAVGLILAFFRKPETEALTTVQILNGIKDMMELNIGDIEYITARPDGGNAILTVTFGYGSEKSYRMIVDENEGTTSLTSLRTDK